LLEYLRHYPDTQLDAGGKARTVWLFEFRIHREPNVVALTSADVLSREMLIESRSRAAGSPEDDEIVDERNHQQPENIERIEHIRGKLLAMEARSFECFVRDLLVHCGFSEVYVTKFSADGGVDVNARAGGRAWIFESALVQVQAKRWLHSVGRKEVAELRGSLQQFARGAVITTGHFSKAAINEASEEGKNPICLVDGFRLAKVVIDEQFPLVQGTASAIS
jgi:restriction system protein